MLVVSKQELKYAFWAAAAVMAVTCLPYLAVWFVEPLHTHFTGALFNPDDHGVYYAWIRQARDGHFLFRNLFTTEPQRGVYFHLYFLILGWIAKIPFVGLGGADHIGRVLSGIAVLMLVYRLAAFFTADVFTRRCVLWTTAFSAGLGWLFWKDEFSFDLPVDIWQPEAITFSSLYTTGLFAIAMALMLGVVICLLLAERHGWRWSVGAGLCALVLGNIHTYDIIHLAAVWGVYVVVRGIVERRFPLRSLGLSALAGAMSVPSGLYMYWLYSTEPIFKSRADTPTMSKPIWFYLAGYGLQVPLAMYGAALLWREPPPADEKDTVSWKYQKLLPLTWAVTGLAIAYAPVAFQRKLVMGYHFPLALLAGFAVAEIARRAAASRPIPRLATVITAVLIGVMSLSCLQLMLRDWRLSRFNETSSEIYPVYWDQPMMHALDWLSKHTPEDAKVLVFPLNGIMVPAYSGRAVYAGHWGETPDFKDTIRPMQQFYKGNWNSEERRQFLRGHGIDYVLYSRKEKLVAEGAGPPRVAPPLAQEPFLKPVFTEDDATLFQVLPGG